MTDNIASYPKAPFMPYSAGYLPSDVFQPCGDLDGRAAADYLKACGAYNIEHANVGTNGEAWAKFQGYQVCLSTNGYLFFA